MRSSRLLNAGGREGDRPEIGHPRLLPLPSEQATRVRVSGAVPRIAPLTLVGPVRAIMAVNMVAKRLDAITVVGAWCR